MRTHDYPAGHGRALMDRYLGRPSEYRPLTVTSLFSKTNLSFLGWRFPGKHDLCHLAEIPQLESPPRVRQYHISGHSHRRDLLGDSDLRQHASYQVSACQLYSKTTPENDVILLGNSDVS